jgi:branched-chain amino acid aminotransferase
MSLKIWIDGKFYDRDNAKLSVYDHGLLYGDGVFEGIRVYSGQIFECEAHLKRLMDSARAIRLNLPRTPEQFRAAMLETVAINNFSDCYIRLVVTRGVGYLGLNPNKCPVASAFIIADTIELYPPETYQKGMSIITSSVVRTHANSLSPRIKSLN